MANFNELFRKNAIYDNFNSHKNIVFWKNQRRREGWNWPLILRWSPSSLFYPSFFHVSYAIYVHYQCFHSVYLTLHTVSSIHSRQLKNKIQLENRKQDETCQKIQDPRERGKEWNQVVKEKSLRKKNKKYVSRRKLLMHHLKVILILLLKNILSEILHADVVVNKS